MSKKRYPWLSVLLAFILVVLANRHWSKLGAESAWQAPFNALSFIYMAGMLAMAHFNETFTYRKTNKLKAGVIIPMYNEDPATFLMMLKSLDRQTMQPSLVQVIDDGSTSKE